MARPGPKLSALPGKTARERPGNQEAALLDDASASVASQASWYSTASPQKRIAAVYSTITSVESFLEDPPVPDGTSARFEEASPITSAAFRKPSTISTNLTRLAMSGSPIDSPPRLKAVLLGRHVQAVRARQRQLADLKITRTQQELEYRHGRLERSRQQQHLSELIRAWLTAVSLGKHTAGWWEIKKRKEVEIKEAIRKFRALRIIQSYWLRRKTVMVCRRKFQTERALRKVLWRIRLFLNCVRRRLARRLVLRFVDDFGLQRLAFVVSKFRHNVVRLQHICLAYYHCTRARMKALRMKWDEIEQAVRRKLEAKEDELDRAHEADLAARRAELRPLDMMTTRLPQLTSRVNDATRTTHLLKESIDQAVESVKTRKVVHDTTLSKLRHTAQYWENLSQQDASKSTFFMTSEQEKHRLLRTYLRSRRRMHARKIKVVAAPADGSSRELSIEVAAKVLQELEESEPTAQLKQRYVWEPMLLLSGPGSEELLHLVEAEVVSSVTRYRVEEEKARKLIFSQYSALAKSDPKQRTRKEGRKARQGKGEAAEKGT